MKLFIILKLIFMSRLYLIIRLIFFRILIHLRIIIYEKLKYKVIIKLLFSIFSIIYTVFIFILLNLYPRNIFSIDIDKIYFKIMKCNSLYSIHCIHLNLHLAIFFTQCIYHENIINLHHLIFIYLRILIMKRNYFFKTKI